MIFKSKIRRKDFEEKFKDMNQLDRIEFRQKRMIIDMEHGYPSLIDYIPRFILNMAAIAAFVFIVSLQVWQILGVEKAAIIMAVMPTIARATLYGSIVLVIINMICMLVKMKAIRRLYEEYYDYKEELEVKNGRKSKSR